MKKLLALLTFLPLAAFAAEGLVKLDRAPVNLTDKPSLQRGAQVFVNYCLNCHSASYMRYNRLTDLGLTEAQIRDNLMFAAERVGDTMTVAMRPADAARWLGAPAPDLTVISRSRGADWLYTYMRTFYRDPSRPLGWNNLAFPNVGMPHVLYELQGTNALRIESKTDGAGHAHEVRTLEMERPGRMTTLEYDRMVGDLVNYLVYMGEPAALTRVQIGVYVMLFLVLLVSVTWLLKRAYWKDVH